MLAHLKSILAGGREIDAIWGAFVRTKSKDGFYRMYKMVGNELHPLRAARTSRIAEKNGGMTVVREKFSTGSRNVRESVLSRKYGANEERIESIYDTNNYVLTDLPKWQLRDNDVTNVANPQMYSIYNNGGVSVVKRYGQYKDKMSHGILSNKHDAKIGGIEQEGSVASGLDTGILSSKELSKFDSWM